MLLRRLVAVSSAPIATEVALGADLDGAGAGVDALSPDIGGRLLAAVSLVLGAAFIGGGPMEVASELSPLLELSGAAVER